jgi:hypothetical protein
MIEIRIYLFSVLLPRLFSTKKLVVHKEDEKSLVFARRSVSELEISMEIQ